MADTKITALAAITTVDPAADVLPIVDISDTSMAASGTTKKITSNQILGSGGTATLASATITGDLTVDTNVLKVDTTNNVVGVGTASPNDWGAKFVSLRSTTGISYTGVWNDGVNSPRLEIGHTSTGSYLNATSASGGAYSRFRFQVAGADQYQVDAGGVFNWYDGAGGTRMTLNSTGLGIGVTPSAWLTAVKALDIGSQAMGIFSGGITHNAYFDNTDGRWEYKGNGAATYWNIQGGIHQWYVAASGIANNPITTFANAAMTLDASGNLLVGLTSPLINTTRRLSVSGTVAAALQSTGAATVETINVWHTATSGNNIFVDFDTEASVTSRGSISYNRAGGLVAYNTTSDYRAKDIIGPVSNSGSLIDSLKVYVGKMKGATIERPMLIAHEAQEVAPYSVTGVKDEVDADGKDKYQQMDVSSFVPLLIAEIQSLRSRVQTLETR